MYRDKFGRYIKILNRIQTEPIRSAVPITQNPPFTQPDYRYLVSFPFSLTMRCSKYKPTVDKCPSTLILVGLNLDKYRSFNLRYVEMIKAFSAPYMSP